MIVLLFFFYFDKISQQIYYLMWTVNKNCFPLVWTWLSGFGFRAWLRSQLDANWLVWTLTWCVLLPEVKRQNRLWIIQNLDQKSNINKKWCLRSKLNLEKWIYCHGVAVCFLIWYFVLFVDLDCQSEYTSTDSIYIMTWHFSSSIIWFTLVCVGVLSTIIGFGPQRCCFLTLWVWSAWPLKDIPLPSQSL